MLGKMRQMPRNESALAVAPEIGPDVMSRGRDFRGAFDHAPVAMAITDSDGVLLNVNPALGWLLGHEADRLVGRSLFEVCHPDDLAAARTACAGLQRSADRTCNLECRLMHASGRPVSVRVSTAKVLDESGAPSHLVMHLEDLTDHEALTNDLRQRALHDPLTGLPNRDLLLDRLTVALARYHRTQEPVSVFYLDLDGFKAINDTHGHATGDAVLVEVAGRLSAVLRVGDTAARSGGDEFVMICENTDRHQAVEIADRLAAELAAPLHVPTRALVLTVPLSVGSASTDGTPATPTDLMHAADTAMYEAKRKRTLRDTRT